jgi:glycosyltransferase involved in cell wall biosynthesis
MVIADENRPNPRIGPPGWVGWQRRLSALREVACPPAQVGVGGLRALQLTNMYPSPEQPSFGVFIQSQVESLARCGIDSEVVEIQGYRSGLNYLRALAMLPARARAAEYDIVHVHFGYAALAAIGVAGLPTVISFCGADLLGRPDESGRRSAASLVLAELGRQAARRADAVIVKSAEMARALGPAHADVEVIPNGLDFGLFKPIPRADARQQLGWPQDAEILFFPANAQERRKNFALAQAVHRRLQAAGRPVRIEWMHARPQSDIVLGMAAADVMLSCSVQEGSPNVVKEAMAMNLPIVATDVGDCAERLRGCLPGAVVPVELDAFVAATAAVLDQRGARSNGRELIQGLGLDEIAERVASVYRRAIDRHAARARRG